MAMHGRGVCLQRRRAFTKAVQMCQLIMIELELVTGIYAVSRGALPPPVVCAWCMPRAATCLSLHAGAMVNVAAMR